MIRKVTAALVALLSFGWASGAAAQAGCKLTLAAEIKVEVRGLRVYAPARVNGKPATFLVDSGAFYSTLDADSATRLGLKKGSVPEGFSMGGLGGMAKSWLGKAETFELAGNAFLGVDFLVAEQSIDDDSVGLLGQNVLNVSDVEYDLAHNVIRIFKPADCGSRMMAYWSEQDGAGVIALAPMSMREPHITGHVKVNGKQVRAVFDTGAPYTQLSMSQARRLGFKRDGEGVTSGGAVGGLGSGRSQSWIAPFDTFSVGDEQINKTRLRVVDVDLGDIDMLIGADFFMSHRVYVARSQGKMYFTYNGGPVFRLERAEGAAEPTDAAGYSRRGTAQMTRGEFDDAIKDFARAAELQPTESRHYYDRAQAYLGAKNRDSALADLDQAIKLKPDYVKALTARGMLHLRRKEPDRAKADFEAAIRAAGEADDVRLTIANAYSQEGRTDEAVAQFDIWIAAHPNSVDYADALNDRCWTRAVGNKDLEKALADCNQVLKSDARNAAVLDSRGLVYLRMRQFDKAISDYDAALRLRPKIAWSLYGRGLAKLGKGQVAEGKADIAAAVAIQKDLPEQAARYGLSEPAAPVNP